MSKQMHKRRTNERIANLSSPRNRMLFYVLTLLPQFMLKLHTTLMPLAQKQYNHLMCGMHKYSSNQAMAQSQCASIVWLYATMWKVLYVNGNAARKRATQTNGTEWLEMAYGHTDTAAGKRKSRAEENRKSIKQLMCVHFIGEWTSERRNKRYGKGHT